MCACKQGTLKDLSLSLCCVNEQSVLLIFSQAYPALAPAPPVVTGKPWRFKSVDIVLAVGSAYAEDVSLCFLPSAAIRVAVYPIDTDPGTGRKVKGAEGNKSAEHSDTSNNKIYTIIHLIVQQ